MTKEKGSDFWSRRKAAVREAELREEAEREQQAAQEKAASLEELSDEEIIDELDLPNPDELEEGDDFKPFLQSIVPERLRRRALRRLWTLNPTLANVDGLVEYGEDFTDAATVFEGIQTTYQVGKGMLKHIEKLAEEAEKNEEAIAEIRPEQEEATSDVEEVTPPPPQPSNDGELGGEEAIAFSPESTNKVALTENEAMLHSENSGADESVVSEDREAESIALSAEAVSPQRRRMRFSFS